MRQTDDVALLPLTFRLIISRVSDCPCYGLPSCRFSASRALPFST